MASSHKDTEHHDVPPIAKQQTGKQQRRQQRLEAYNGCKGLACVTLDSTPTTSAAVEDNPIDYGNNRLLTGFWFTAPLAEQNVPPEDLTGTPLHVQMKFKALEKALKGYRDRQRNIQKAFHYRNMVKNQQVEDVQAENKALEAKYHNLKAEFETLKTQPGELQEKHIIREQNAYGVTKSRHIALSAEFEGLQSEHEQLRINYETKLDQHVADQKAIHRYKEQIRNLELRLKRKDEHLTTMKQREVRQTQRDMQVKMKMEEKYNELVHQHEKSELENQLLREEVKLLSETAENLIEAKVKRWHDKRAEELRP
ncbi:hypothetical protein LTR84_011337 [Exophiala bonariae]|uniref:Uncharacterized protein n=1 Tax=Exophiala bonariae TaxID=1690606 RepID=A0AAV9MUK6_9EURO|nr:hypothetical protein LTR84_011337 [Exophiala bonariae]